MKIFRLRKKVAIAYFSIFSLLAVFYFAFFDDYIEDIREQPLIHCMRVELGRALPRVREDFDFTINYFGLQFSGNTRNFAERSVVFLGAFERKVLYFMRDALEALNRENSTAIDVGAFTGTHSLYLSLFADQVHAFEPAEDAREHLLKNIRQNAIEHIVVHSEGLGDSNSLAKFYTDKEGLNVTGSFVDGFRSKNTEEQELVLVRGDDKLNELGVERVDLVKVDVEGFEVGVLKGLKDTLRRDRPVVVIELSFGPSIGFQDSNGFYGSFPQDYLFYEISDHYNRSGDYDLSPYVFSFDPDIQPQVVAFPKELEAIIPKKSSNREN